MKEYAIKEHHLYDKAFRGGARFVGKTVAVYVLRDRAAGRITRADPLKRRHNRVGLSVGKKIGGAVARNRAKRLLREAYRAVCREQAVATGYLVVLAARAEISGKKTADVTADLRRAFSRLGLVEEEIK